MERPKEIKEQIKKSDCDCAVCTAYRRALKWVLEEGVQE